MNWGPDNEGTSSQSHGERAKRSFQILENAGWSPDEGDVSSIAFTGVSDSCGSTSVLIEIAQSVSAEGVRTLIVDANPGNPQLHHSFSVTQQPGLCEVLRGQADLPDVCFETSIPGLSIIPAGRPIRSVRFGTHSKKTLKTILLDLKPDFDLVLFDTVPPGNQRLANHWLSVFDRVVLVATLDRFSTSQVRRVRKSLDSAGARISGVVVNHNPPYSGRASR